MRVRNTVLLGAALLLWSTAAQAGPVEQLVDLYIQPSDTDRMVMVFDFGGGGFFYSSDAGDSWTMMPNSVIDPALTRIGSSHAIANDGTLFAGFFDKLRAATDGGCSWGTESDFDGLWVTDFAHDPIDTDVMYTITSSGGKQNGAYKRSADGSWAPLGTADDILISRIEVVDLGGGKLRFYESGVRGMIDGEVDGTPRQLPNYIIRVSEDEGASWTEHELGDVGLKTVRLEAVDPTDPDRIVLSLTENNKEDHILVSPDQGASLKADIAAEKYDLTVLEFGGLAFAPDGRLWVGNRGEPDAGLYLAADAGQAPTLLAGDVAPTCVEFANDTLYLCQIFEFGTADQTTGEFTRKFFLPEAASFACSTDEDVCDEESGTGALATGQLKMNFCGPSHFPQADVCGICMPKCDVMDGAGGFTGSMNMDDSCPDTDKDAGPDACVGDCQPDGGGTGGDSGAGGASGAAGAAGTSPEDDEDEDAGGCSCSTPGAHRESSGARMVGLGLVLGLGWRRRRGR